MSHILYADVEYSSVIYTDAQSLDGKWFFEDSNGDVQTFVLQHLVKPLNEPTPYRRHPQPSPDHEASKYKSSP